MSVPPYEPEQAVRLILRRLRRALHELNLAKDVGGFLTAELQPAIDAVEDAVAQVEQELLRLRQGN